MAILNCPECHEKISSTASTCVHCGAPIVVCPECQTPYVKGIEVCAECGYEFKKHVDSKPEATQPVEDEKAPAKDKTPKITAAELNDSCKKFSFLDLLEVLCLLAYGLWIWLFYALKNWSDGTMAMLESFEDTRDMATTLLVIALALMLADIVLRSVNKRSDFQLRIDMAKTKKLSLQQVAENTLDVDYKKKNHEYADDQADGLSEILNAELYQNDPASKKRFYNWTTISIFLRLITCVLLFLFIDHNVDIYMQAELLKSDLLNIPGGSLDAVEKWWMPVVAVIVEIINKTYTRITKKSSAKQRREWVSKQFPEKLPVYDKYLVGLYAAKQMAKDIVDNQTRGGV